MGRVLLLTALQRRLLSSRWTSYGWPTRSNTRRGEPGRAPPPRETRGARLTHAHRTPPRITAHYADVADPASIAACVADIVAAHGKIDHLVTSAGFTENFASTEYPVDRMRKLWAVNVDGTYLFAVEVARHLMERKSPGSMVFIGSMSGAIVNVPQLQT